MNILIMAGGWLNDAFLLNFLKYHTVDQVIAVDGALKQADRLGISFQYLVGDFDTIDPEILKKYEHSPDINVERHIPEKNETDSELAMRMALSWNPETIYLLGATGGRMDHTLGNIELLYQCLRLDVNCYIYDEYNRMSLVREKKQFFKNQSYGTYISFLPLFGQAEDVNLEGFKYPLCHAVLVRGSTLAISNELLEEAGEVRVGDGILLCVEASDFPLTAHKMEEMYEAEKNSSDQ